jgi:hypothetical protein
MNWQSELSSWARIVGSRIVDRERKRTEKDVSGLRRIDIETEWFGG